MISAASHHFSWPAIAFKITSWIFIIRSVSADGICCSVACTPPSFSHPLSPRTFHLLIEPDKSHANDIPGNHYFNPQPQDGKIDPPLYGRAAWNYPHPTG